MIDPTGIAEFDTYRDKLTALMRGGSVVPAWTPDGSAFGFVEGTPDERTAWKVALDTGEKTPLLDVEKARTAITAATGTTPMGRGVPFDEFTFSGDDEIRVRVGGIDLLLELETYEVSVLDGTSLLDELYAGSQQVRSRPRQYLRSTRLNDPTPAWEVPSPDGAYLLSTEQHNIVARSTYDGRQVRLTDDGRPEHEWRFDVDSILTTSVRKSAGKAGTTACWSPDARRVAAYKVDLRGVYRSPQVHYLKTQDEVSYRYVAQAGGVFERTTLHVLDLHGRPPVELDLGDTTDSYPVSVAWLPDSSRIVVFQLSRDCRRADVYVADATTGGVTPLFSETGESFVRIQHDIYSQAGAPKTGLWLTPDGENLIWLSERSGWRHLYLYDLGGNLVRQLTDGDWPVEEVVLVRDGFVYFTGHRDQSRPYDLHLYKVALDGGEIEALTEARGVHQVEFAPSGTAFLDTHSTVSQPPVVELRGTDGRAITEVSRADIGGFETTGYVSPEEFTVVAADGKTELWGVMFRPHGFDPAKRYPLVEYIYGGPQVAAVRHGFLGPGPAHQVMQNEPQVLAQLGYVTLMVDGRGTPGRSKAFHDKSYLRWANVLADDHAETIRQLADRYEFIDPERIGIIGQSWGGWSAVRCLADRPDVYRAAVASVPAFDPYAWILSECYLDLPQRNPDGYAFASGIALADDIDGAVMLAAGTSDSAIWRDTVKMSEALIRAGKLHEFVVLPGQYHGFGTTHNGYFWRKVEDFFGRHLSVSS